MQDLAADVARRIQGKYYGKYRGFVASNQDPEHVGRLQLRIPSLLGDQVTSWALPCLPFGGSAGFGWFAIPEVEAQVWVEFEEGELRRPIWTGTFWQQKDESPADARKDTPTTRLLQTPAGHILQFDDETDKEQIRLHHAGGAELRIDERGSITITDQVENTITLDADAETISIADSHSNAITLSSSGIKIQDANGNTLELSAAGVKLSASAQLVLDAPLILLGGSGGEPVIKGPSFLTLFATHVHATASPGSPTSPPIPQGEATSLSQAVLTK